MPSFRQVAVVGLAGAAALGAYAFLIEPRWLERTHTRVPIQSLPPDLEGLRVVLLSDLHPGDGTSYGLIARACRLAASANPHLVALTGDLVDSPDDDLRRVLAIVTRHLRPPLGIYIIPGNHDHKRDMAVWHRTVQQHPGVTDLTNRATFHKIGGAMLRIAGVDDLDKGRPDLASALQRAPEADCTLLLAHNPDQAERVKQYFGRVDLVLSGHTHGGQVRLPFIGALRNPARNGHLYDMGLQKRPWSQVYTSRGVGTVHLNVRFLCRPEVAVLELVNEA